MAETQFKRDESIVDLDIQRTTMKVYPVMDPELDSIGDASERETTALAFGGICSGAFVSGLLALLLATPDSPSKWGGYAGLMLCLLVLSCFFAKTWWFERGVRRRTVDKIKSRQRQVELAPIPAEPTRQPPQSA